VVLENLKRTDFELVRQIPLHFYLENPTQPPHLKPVKTFSVSLKYAKLQSMDSNKYLRRIVDSQLLELKNSDVRKPLLLRGARQIGNLLQ